jgi:hypothetical protein
VPLEKVYGLTLSVVGIVFGILFLHLSALLLTKYALSTVADGLEELFSPAKTLLA